MKKQVKVAVVQDASIAFDKAANFARVQELLELASRDGPDLVLFPEAFISGFPAGTDWGGPATGVRSDVGHVDFLRYIEGAIKIPGPDCDVLGAMARQHDVNLVIGVIETNGTTLGCSVLHFDRLGALLHVRRKVMPTMAERTIWGQADGTSLRAVDFDFGRIATVICWENYMPLLRYSMYAQGISIYCAPTADDLESWVRSMQHIAVEARSFVLSACQFTKRGDFPKDYGWFPSDDPDFIVSRGGSCIIDPFGNIVCDPVYDRKAIISATLDLDMVVQARHSFDVTGHYSRPDIFHLSVDRKDRSSITFES